MDVDSEAYGTHTIMKPETITPACILVVDDERSICRLVATLLEAQGHIVLQAAGGKQALESAASADRPIDLLITDIRMQGMDGLALARELGAANPALKIIFMSGYFGEEEGRPEAIQGIWEFIAKPFALPDLMALVDRVLGAPVLRFFKVES